MSELDDRLAAQMRAGAISEGLEQRQALARIEGRLFGRPSKPITLSRYVLLEPCGRGSRGMVVRAYDPQLDRKVAIKLLLSTSSGTSPSDAALLREAQAMARVSHPNVITVHDVGSYDEHDLGLDPETSATGFEIPARGVFVVMELIEGLDLREWLAAERRDWQTIVRVFVAAGRGLAAAHEAGLVHRDFKPSNVRVGTDGRVCVLDFGLARGVADPLDGRAMVVGTPMYMSPEQHRGRRADARSDQYSFGVALYEALVGAPPFVGSLAEIEVDKQTTQWLRSRDDLGLPASIWGLLRRSVSPAPSDRYTSITTLLEGLEGCLDRRRWRWLALAGIPLAVVVLGLTLTRDPEATSATEDLCSGADARVEQVWNTKVRAGIEQRLRSSGVRYAGTTFTEVARELDDYTTAWAAQHRDACEATRVRGEQSETVLDLRMACLDLRLHEVELITTTLATADASVVENAVVAVNALGWLGACSDLDALQSRVRLPRDPQLRKRIEHGYARLTEAMINEAAGRYAEALAIADDVAEQARVLDHAPLLAAADLRRAAAFEGRGDFAAAERALLDSLARAEASRDEVVAADAWLRMLWIVGVELARGDEGEAWLRLAEAAVARLGDDPVREATLLHNRAGLRVRQGLDELALADYLAALDAQITLLGPNDPAVARTENHIANALINLRRYEQAWIYAERSLALRVATLGADHPLVAASYNNMAVIRLRQGDPEAALEQVEHALAITAIAGTRTEVVTRQLARDAHKVLGQNLEARTQIERLLELPADRYPSFMTRETLTAELAALEVSPPDPTVAESSRPTARPAHP